MGGSPGVVVMGWDSRPEGVGSNPWMDIFSHIFVVKFVYKKTIIKRKRGRDGPFLIYYLNWPGNKMSSRLVRIWNNKVIKKSLDKNK